MVNNHQAEEMYSTVSARGFILPSCAHNSCTGITSHNPIIHRTTALTKAVRRALVSKPIKGPHSHAPRAKTASNAAAKFGIDKKKIAAMANGTKIKAVKIRCFNKRESF